LLISSTSQTGEHEQALGGRVKSAGQIVGLKQESELRWRARFFDVDLGTIEVVPLTDAFASDTVIKTVTAIHAKSALRDNAVVSA
jgi:hypothetical protein